MNTWMELGWWAPTLSDGTSLHDAMLARTGPDVLPPPVDWYNAFGLTPFNQTRVVILGQDPYPTPGMAHGLAFSVRPEVTALPPSLRNILKELKNDQGIDAKNGSLVPWAKRGVLLLNTHLTVAPRRPLSHANYGWEKLTGAALRALCVSRKSIVFVLWGAAARAAFYDAIEAHPNGMAEFDNNGHQIISSAHPSPRSAERGFFGSRPFGTTNRLLEERNQPPIDWSLA